MTGLSVFLASAATLAFEVLLTRIFSISQWNHLAFMVISIALFGFAASGSVLSVQEQRRRIWIDRLALPEGQLALCIGFCCSALGATLIMLYLPLDYFRLPVQPIQFLYLLIAYVALIVPFLCTGLIIIVAYAAHPYHSGRIYFANMTGSALGAIYPAVMLPYVTENRLMLMTAAVPLIGLLALILPGRRQSESGPGSGMRPTVTGLAILLGLTMIALLLGIEGPPVRLSDYKALAQSLLMPDTRITASHNALQGRIDRIESPTIRYAPGLSLTFKGHLPEQAAVFQDGEHRLVLYRVDRPGALNFARYLLSYTGYRLSDRAAKVLILLKGGGSAIACALAAGAAQVTVVTPHPRKADIIQNHYGLPVVKQPYRAYLAQSPQTYDVIQVENWGSSLPGTAALDQNYLFTTDTIGRCLDRLEPTGMLILSRMLMLPPSDSIRLWASAYEALRSSGITAPQRHLVMLRNWDTYTLLISRRPFTDHRQIIAVAEQLNVDLVYLDRLDPGLPNRFNQFEEPYHYRSIRRLAEAYQNGKQDRFYTDYPMDIAPQSDARPFPARVLKWFRLADLYQSTGSRLYALLLSGEIVVAVVLVQAMGIAILLVALPYWLSRKKGAGLASGRFFYFTAVGLGFMAVEFYFLKQYALLCGDPIVAFTLVVAGILVFSGIGGYGSQSLALKHLPAVLLGLIGVLILYLICLDAWMDILLGWKTGARLAAAFLLLLPPGIAAGIPFPLGMRCLLQDSADRSGAWTVNGCASVISAILAAQVAISWGIPALMAGGIAAYSVALISSVRQAVASRPST